MRVNVCVTAFNEESNIPSLANLIKEIVSQCSDVGFVLVDNGSSDGTYKCLKELKFLLADVNVLQLQSNQLYGGGMKHAILESSQNHVCLIPADNQYSANDIVTCIESYRLHMRSDQNRSLAVIGRRRKRSDPLTIRIMSWFYSELARISLGLPRLDINGLPKVFDRSLVPVQLLENLPNNPVFDAALLAALHRRGCKFFETSVAYKERAVGQSSWSNRRIRFAWRMFRNLMKACRELRQK